MRVEDHLDADSACAKRNGIGTELKMVSVSYWLRDEGWLEFFFFFFFFFFWCFFFGLLPGVVTFQTGKVSKMSFLRHCLSELALWSCSVCSSIYLLKLGLQKTD